MQMDINFIQNQLGKDEIRNIDQVMTMIQNSDLDINSHEFLENLLAFYENNDLNIEGLDNLINVIETKLLEYKLDEQLVSGIDALEEIKKRNPDLNKIEINRTKKENNTSDYDKDTDYITIRHDDGEVEVLVCDGDAAVNEYLKEYRDDITEVNAERVFEHFKREHRELKFLKKNEIEIDNLSYGIDEKDRDVVKYEFSMVEKKAESLGIHDEVEVGKDHNGERLYRVGDGIYKVVDGREVVPVRLSTEERQQHQSFAEEQQEVPDTSTDDLMNELDESPAMEQQQEEVARNTMEVDNDLDIKRNVDYYSIPTMEENQVDINRLNMITSKRDIYKEPLSVDELNYIDSSIKTLIETMEFRQDNPDADLSLSDALTDYMRPYLEKYDDIKAGLLPESELTPVEKEMCEIYTERRSNLAVRNYRKLDLQYPGTQFTNPSSGIATIVILLEIGILAMFVLMFLSLDI